MRIPMFSKYIREKIREQELQPCVLKNCPVVIDGQNFLYNMYRASKLPFEFGCESDRFAAYLRTRLNMFKKANVKCYFVFKGGNSDIERTIKLIEKDKDAENFGFMRNNNFVMPEHMKEVYKQVLDELGIPYAVSEFECKRECVALAEQLQCAVISDDIEFCFLKAPYIKYQTLKYNHKMKGIDGLQYKRENFLKKHSLTEQKLAMFAVLTDTNLFPAGFFNGLLKSMGALHSDYYERCTALWRWLSNREESYALDFINNFLNQDHDDKQKFESEMTCGVDFMQNKQESFVANYLLNGGTLDFNPEDLNWFEKGVVSKRIAIPYINLYKYNYLLKWNAIENTNSSDSMMLSMDIVKYAYNLLTDFKRDEFTFVIGSNQVKIGAKRSAPKDIQTPVFAGGWNDVKKMGLFENFLKENCISEALVAQAPGDAAMLIIALVYFARKKAADNVTVEKQVYSVITCFAVLAANSDIPKNDRDEARKATQTYFKVSKTEIMRIFNRELLHHFVELQQCLQQLNYLNVLCGSPYAPTVYHRAYNGTFVYTLFYEMQSADDCTVFINNLLSGSTSVLNYVNQLYDLYTKML